jgi:hypothetical protein
MFIDHNESIITEACAMKRSSKVTLVLMAVAGIGVGAYAMAPNNACRQPQPGAVPGGPPQDCKSSSSHASGGHGGSSFHAFGSGGSDASSAAGTASRGGFGATGHGISSGG